MDLFDKTFSFSPFLYLFKTKTLINNSKLAYLYVTSKHFFKQKTKCILLKVLTKGAITFKHIGFFFNRGFTDKHIKYERIPKTTFLTYDYQSGRGHIKYECIPMKLKFFLKFQCQSNKKK
jgi:hypothetical protein